MSEIPHVHSDTEIYKALKTHFGSGPSGPPGPPGPLGRVLISAPYMMPNIDAFRKFFEERGHEVIVADVQERLEVQDLERYHGRYDVALIGDDRYTQEVLRRCGAKALSKWGTGIDSIHLQTAKELGISVHNTPDAFSEPVAESILAAILAFNRTIVQSSALMHGSALMQGDPVDAWVKIPGKTLSEISVGIIGLGNVGRALLRKLLALGGCEKIVTYDILGEIPLEDTEGFCQLDSLHELLNSDLDFLITACCQTENNVGMIGADELAKLPNRAVVINMARGRLVNEQDLVAALQEGSIAGAALDVFWDEPLPGDSGLRIMPNVLLTSHNANSSPKYWLKVHINTIRNALPYLEEERD